MASHLVALVSGNGWHVQDLIRASRLVGCRLDAVPFPRVVGRVGGGASRVEAGGIDLGAVDGVLVRMMPPGSLEQVIFRMDALHRLEAMGVPVLNPPRAVEAAVDKYLALAKLAGEGLPVPETWVGESAREAMEAFHALGGDVVIKPLFGAEGRGLVRVSDTELASRALRAIERIGSVLYVQRHVSNVGRDFRAFVLGGRVIGAIRRTAREGEWRANVAVGGRAEAVTLDDEAQRLAIRAAEAVGARMAGVDLLPDEDSGRLVVLEVNAVPGWRALSRETGVDVAAAILEESAKGGARS
ncbi:ATP-grasp domain-containing protein [Tautonia plasticadhaerens]|uniref:Alpha-aminoadipate--LysW ligase LysX n=1 Tax=Tautonia plasticadhaerens TaxID=2527974 RepID=A0A518HAU5_9BACT|nr:RimK family alpha-L-glutamate ligase [Tautonia plasticadhaerens]QDV37959.1 Alpha-aminoadipate--LysW ligase LysX [Tautonia plasticadhaerens]